MTQLSFELEEESRMLSPLDKLRLPKDKNLPHVIREIVTNAPANRKIPAFEPALCTLPARSTGLFLRFAKECAAIAGSHRRRAVQR